MIHFTALVAAVAAGLFVGMLVLFECGRWLGRRRSRADPEAGRMGLATVEGAFFALLGLLIAFTFSGAASRFDDRRQLIVEESNAATTAWSRIALVPEADQPRLRALLQQYVDARIASKSQLTNPPLAAEEHAKSVALQPHIWSAAVAATAHTSDQRAAMLLLPAINQLFDVSTKHEMARKTHAPTIVFALLIVLSLGSALFAGYGVSEARTRPSMHMLAFATIMAVTLYVIIDLEYPRFGLIRIDGADRVFDEARQSMR